MATGSAGAGAGAGAGVAVAIVWRAAGPSPTSAGYHHNWSFGRKQIHEACLQAQQEHPERAAPPGMDGDLSWA
jgi:hypothetical protein